MDAPTSVTEGREERLACLQENYPSSLCGGPVCADCCPPNQEQPAEAGQLSGGLRPPAGTASQSVPGGAARRRGALAERTAGVGLAKGQVNCAAAHPTGRRLAPQRLDVALGSAAGGKRIPEMSPTRIVIQTTSIVEAAAAECRRWKPFQTRCTLSFCKGHVPGRKGNKQSAVVSPCLFFFKAFMVNNKVLESSEHTSIPCTPTGPLKFQL